MGRAGVALGTITGLLCSCNASVQGLHTNPMRRFCDGDPFTDEDTEAQRAHITCLRWWITRWHCPGHVRPLDSRVGVPVPVLHAG